MNVKQRLSMGGGNLFSGGGSVPAGGAAQPNVGGNLGFQTSVSGNATGPALVLVLLTVGLVLHYVWTRGEQGGR